VTTFVSGAKSGDWMMPIKSVTGKLVYALGLVPDFDTRHHAVLVSLVLRRLGDAPDDANRFDPSGRLHGL
jgi:hypothetical protein